MAEILIARMGMHLDRASRRRPGTVRRGGVGRGLWVLWVTAQTGCVIAIDPTGTARFALDEIAGTSQHVSWTCTGAPCPWGDSLGDEAIAWPASADPGSTRLGYTASPAAYLPAPIANGLIIEIEAGTAGVYAGDPLADSHRVLATLSAGQRFEVAGVVTGEVLSVQSATAFEYHVIPPALPPPDDPSAPSQTTTWNCAGSPCPWGDSVVGEAVVWPPDTGAITTRLGYSVVPAIYLPASRANGATIAIHGGSAGVYAGRPGDDAHRWLGTIAAGASFVVTGLLDGEVLSVQSEAPFRYQMWLGPQGGDGGGGGGDAVQAIEAFWHCNIPACHGDPWTGAVINWPSWAAYQSNARAGDQSRSVYAADGTALYPYMGAWAEGCQVTAVSGVAVIIEWQRGADTWRATRLLPGQSHTIHLVAPENGAMIETDDGVPTFGVTLQNCTPQPVPR